MKLMKFILSLFLSFSLLSLSQINLINDETQTTTPIVVEPEKPNGPAGPLW